MAARDWCGAPRVHGLVRVMVWTESTALTVDRLVRVMVWTESTALAVDRLHNPKGYAISAVHLKSDSADAKAQRITEEDNSRGQCHGQR